MDKMKQRHVSLRPEQKIVGWQHMQRWRQRTRGLRKEEMPARVKLHIQRLFKRTRWDTAWLHKNVPSRYLMRYVLKRLGRERYR